MTTIPVHDPRPGVMKPMLLGGLVAGTLDAIDGVVFNGVANHLGPVQVLQYIASGVYGARSFDMGLASAAVGAGAHYFIALVLAAIYVTAARIVPALNRHVLVMGSAFGVAVFLTMNFVVLPLTHVVATPITPAFLVNGLIGHALFVGVAIAWAAARPRPRPAAQQRIAAMTTPADLVSAFYARLAEGDVPGLLALLHPDLEWTEAEGFPYYSGVWRQPQEVLEKLLKPLMRDWDDFSAVAEDFITQGDRVVSLGAYAGVNKATGKAMRAPFAHVWRVADGRLKRFDMYTDTLLVARAMAA